MKFGTVLGHALGKIFGYRAIEDLSFNKNSKTFSKICMDGVCTFDSTQKSN